MTQIFTINYRELLAVCDELQLINPDRTKSYLDLVLQNIEKTNLAAVYNGIIPVEIDFDTMKVSLLGDSFPAGFVTYTKAKTYEEELILQFLDGIALAEELDCYDRIFRMIKGLHI